MKKLRTECKVTCSELKLSGWQSRAGWFESPFPFSRPGHFDIFDLSYSSQREACCLTQAGGWPCICDVGCLANLSRGACCAAYSFSLEPIELFLLLIIITMRHGASSTFAVKPHLPLLVFRLPLENCSLLSSTLSKNHTVKS